jgi:hypothetical protein
MNGAWIGWFRSSGIAEATVTAMAAMTNLPIFASRPATAQA